MAIGRLLKRQLQDKDTPAPRASRQQHAEALGAAQTDVERCFPCITPENVREALQYQEKRIAFHLEKLKV